jgi:hypothetical protein
MAVVAAIFLFVIGVGLLSLGLNRRLYSIRSNHQLAARCAADYGLTKAVHEMNLQLPVLNNSALPAESSVQIPGNDATYSYTVKKKDNGTYYVEAYGRSGSITKTVLCDLRLKSPFEYAILTKNTLDIGSVSTVNCNSCGNIPLKIGTTNNLPNIITLYSKSVINGDILLGQGGIPSEVVDDKGATINGSIYAVATDFDLPTPKAPTNLTDKNASIDITKKADNRTLTDSNSGIYTSIRLQGMGVVLTIDGDVTLWVTGGITIGTPGGSDSACIDINNANPNAKLTIYLGGSFEGKNGAGVNNIGDPNKLTIYGLSSNSINIKNSGDFCGTIYAPDAEVTIYAKAKVFGSVIAKDYKQDNSAVFTYDARLRKASIEDKFVRFVPTHWREQ